MRDKKTRIMIIILIVAIISIAVVSIKISKNKNEVKQVETASAPEETLPELLTSKYVDLKGIYVDKSDKKDSKKSLIYVLYTVKSDDKNIKFYTYMAKDPDTALSIRINNINEYKDVYAMSKKLQDNFRDTGYEVLNDGQEVLSGDSMKCIAAFRVSKNDLKPGGIIKLTLEGTNSFEEVFEYRTDDVKYFNNTKELLKSADNETYKKVEKLQNEKLAKVDKKTEKAIYEFLDETYFEWYESTIKVRYEFHGKKFTVESSLGLKNKGIYEIRKKVILLHYDTGLTNQLPYKFKNGEVELEGTPE